MTRDAEGEGVERHANSTQYLFALDGPVETHVQTEDGWRVDCYGQGDPAALENRWHVVPAGVWHKSVAPGGRNWSVVAFHSARDVRDEYQMKTRALRQAPTSPQRRTRTVTRRACLNWAPVDA